MTTLDLYKEFRNNWLEEITEYLSNDERFVAGWLTGSFGRNAADSMSDIDLNVVVSDIHNSDLCLIFESASAQTSSERFLFFSQFGTPALIHENNHNAPEGGTFTFVLYTDSALMVDWVLIPQSKASRPYQSKLLFDKVNIPVTPHPQPEELEQSKKSVASNWAFFWMMTAVTVKHIIRGDGVFVTQWIENLHGLIQDIERRLNREPWNYIPYSLSQIQTTTENQIESINKLCKSMQKIKPRVSEFIGSEPLTPLAEIELLLSLVNR